MIEGSSIDSSILEQVKSKINPGETVLVILDSNHTKDHVLKELEAYSPLVTKGSYIVATDGIMELVCGLDRTAPNWNEDNPKAAAIEFVGKHPEYEIEVPLFPFNESSVNFQITYWPSAYIKRK